MSSPTVERPSGDHTLNLGRPRADTTATAVTFDGRISESGRGPSSQFRLRRQYTLKASKEYSVPTAGLEPGIDPDAQGPGEETLKALHTACQMTIVEFSEDKIKQSELWNDDLEAFLAAPREEWVKVRWINCNGLSWDVISQITRHYNLHRLAVEDMLTEQTLNMPKCDWYPDHCFIILPLLKLLEAAPRNNDHHHKRRSPYWKRFIRRFSSGNSKDPGLDLEEPDENIAGNSRNVVRSLQRAYGGPNTRRIEYMEKNSSLANNNKIVHVEQVSAFLTADGTVVSFFEISGDDIEPSILARLYSEKTLLRTSSDPSMMLQAIIDAVVDLSFPVVGAYQDVIAELELSVLVDPSIKQSKQLYIITSELSQLKSTIAPIASVVTALKDHRRGFMPKVKGLTGVEVSEMTRIYLQDVLDHVLLISDNLEIMKRSADNMIDLIFNMIGSMQNSNMRQLTITTIVFLPPTFVAGYFGMNFEKFPSIHNSDAVFWMWAVPLSVAVLVFTLRESIGRLFLKVSERKSIRRRNERFNRGPGAKTNGINGVQSRSPVAMGAM